MRWGGRTAEVQATELFPGQMAGGPILHSPRYPRASSQGGGCRVGVLTSQLWGEVLQKDIWIPGF